MRAVLVVSLLVLLSPAIALAQSQPTPAAEPAAVSPPATAAAPKRGGDITRDQYIERARHAAEKRFDKMDANHDGVLTAEERQATRAKRAERRASKAQ